MRKKILMLALAGILCVGITGNVFAEQTDSVATESSAVAVEGAVILSAAEADFSEGEGISTENEEAATYYDETYNLISNLAQDGTVTYTVPDGTEGTYDVYLTVSKIAAQFTSQPFTFRVNDGDSFSVPVDCQVPADSSEAFTKDGTEYNTGTFTDTGLFQILTGQELKAGDTIEVTASFGAKAPSLKGTVYPSVGDILLAPAGTAVGTGYDGVIEEEEEVDETDPLSGLNILWIGSSVTYGAYSGGHYSMVDAIEDNHAAAACEKYAISATTLVNQSDSSYVARLKLIPTDKTPDLVVVQLSTNDATTNKPFGEIAEDFDLDSFDDTTIAGAIETIIAYTQETFGCPVVFYTGTYCEKENYVEMVDLLLEIQEKWGIGVVDMFNNEEMTAVYGTDLYDTYMYDEVHPTRTGYVEWWTPVIEESLTAFLTEQE
ncbi:MAG: SGNH/GDSL hydrolase family protein [Clostridiales bacterium]|nr:SGNH/GDSL hydrolase family protein [Clostridiales bacterium]